MATNVENTDMEYAQRLAIEEADYALALQIDNELNARFDPISHSQSRPYGNVIAGDRTGNNNRTDLHNNRTDLQTYIKKAEHYYGRKIRMYGIMALFLSFCAILYILLIAGLDTLTQDLGYYRSTWNQLGQGVLVFLLMVFGVIGMVASWKRSIKLATFYLIGLILCTCGFVGISIPETISLLNLQNSKKNICNDSNSNKCQSFQMELSFASFIWLIPFMFCFVYLVTAFLMRRTLNDLKKHVHYHGSPTVLMSPFLPNLSRNSSQDLEMGNVTHYPRQTNSGNNTNQNSRSTGTNIRRNDPTGIIDDMAAVLQEHAIEYPQANIDVLPPRRVDGIK